MTKEGINEKKMLKDIRNQYLTIINNAKEYASKYSHFWIKFIQDIKKGIENLKEFDLPLIYTLYYQL